MTQRGRGRKSVRRMKGADFYRATFLSIMAIGLFLCSGLDIAAHEAADGWDLSRTEPEMMQAKLSPMDAWLYELGFAYDPALGRVRNPFDFSYAELDVTLQGYFIPFVPMRIGLQRTKNPLELMHQEQFVSLDESVLKVITGAAGSGKTAHLLMLRHLLKDQSTLFFQGPAAFTVMQLCANNVFHAEMICARYGEPAIMLLDFSIESNSAFEVAAQALEKIHNDISQSNLTRFYIALPQRFRSLIVRYPSWEIRWNGEKLSELLRQRLLWASEGRSNILNFKQICESSVPDPHGLLVKIAKTPRRLFDLGQCLLHSHLISPLSEKSRIQKDDWDFLFDYASAQTSKAPDYHYPSSFAIMGKPDIAGIPLREDSVPPCAPSRSLQELSDLLQRLDDVALQRLFILYYPGLADKINPSMRRDEKANLLLDYCRRNEDEIGGAIELVKKEIARETRKND